MQQHNLNTFQPRIAPRSTSPRKELIIIFLISRDSLRTSYTNKLKAIYLCNFGGKAREAASSLL